MNPYHQILKTVLIKYHGFDENNVNDILMNGSYHLDYEKLKKFEKNYEKKKKKKKEYSIDVFNSIFSAVKAISDIVGDMTKEREIEVSCEGIPAPK